MEGVHLLNYGLSHLVPSFRPFNALDLAEGTSVAQGYIACPDAICGSLDELECLKRWEEPFASLNVTHVGLSL